MPSEHTDYGYDDDRLVGVRYGTTGELYRMDAVGNRTGERRVPASKVIVPILPAAFAALSPAPSQSWQKCYTNGSMPRSRGPRSKHQRRTARDLVFRGDRVNLDSVTRRFSSICVVALVAAACAQDVAPRVEDGTREVLPTFPPTSPSPPAVPAPAQLTPCPPGWREMASPVTGEVVTCEPWPQGGLQTCPQDSAHFPGTPGCSRIGSDCPAGEWPEGLPTNRPVRYVRAGGGAGGNGSQASPFGSAGAALVTATAGTILALGKGTFDEAVLLPAQITLWGACVAQTHLSISGVGTNPTVRVLGDGAAVRNLHVGGPHPGFRIDVPGTGFQMTDLVISGAQYFGVLAEGTVVVTGSRVVIRDTQPQAVTNSRGDGLIAEDGAQVDLKWASLESNHAQGVAATGAGTQVTLEDTGLRGTKSQVSNGEGGEGLSAQSQARIEGKRVVLEQNHYAAFSSILGAEVSLTDAVVRDTRPNTSGPNTGIGGLARSGGHLVLRRVLVHRSRNFGVLVDDPKSTLLAFDVVIRETLEALGNKQAGFGLLCSGGAAVNASRLALERNRGVGLIAHGAGGVVDLEDLTVRSTEGLLIGGSEGYGLEVFDRASLTVSRGWVEESRCAGIVASGPETVLALFDVTVRGGRGCFSDGLGGEGLAVQLGAAATATRLLLEKNRAGGIRASSSATRVTLSDVLVRDTSGEYLEGTASPGGQYGDGLHATHGAQVEVTRALFERNREAGIYVTSGARVSGSHVVLRETLQSDCPPTRCAAQAGVGAIASGNGALALSMFSIHSNAMAGLQLVNGGTADLQAGEISENPLGVNVQTKDFDLARIQRDVIFHRNVTNLDSATLPSPPPPPLTIR